MVRYWKEFQDNIKFTIPLLTDAQLWYLQ